jgi:serine/threonine-protein kinase ATR
MAVGVFEALSTIKSTPPALLSKAVTLLILLCSDMVSHPEESPVLVTADPDVQRTYCIALAIVSRAAIHDRSIGRLAASKLVDEPLVLFPALAEDSDVWVRC